MTNRDEERTPPGGTDGPLVSLTAKAREALHAMARRDGPADPVLRVGVTGGGCSGFEYVLAFEDAPKPGDRVVELDGLRIVVDPASEKFIRGVTIDHVATLRGTGFKFLNPGAQRTCDCGSSFSA